MVPSNSFLSFGASFPLRIRSSTPPPELEVPSLWADNQNGNPGRGNGEMDPFFLGRSLFAIRIAVKLQKRVIFIIHIFFNVYDFII